MKIEATKTGGGGLVSPPASPLTGGSELGRRAILERFTFVLPLLVLVVLTVQFVAASLLDPTPLQNSTIFNSTVATFFVNVTAALIYREFRRTPANKRFAYVLPSFILPVLAAMAALLMFRLEYSNWLLLLGIGSGIAILVLVSAMQRPTSGRLIYLVPGLRTKQLARELTFLRTEMLQSPSELARCGDGAVVADLRQDLSSEWERGIAHAVINGVPVYNVKQVRESLTGRVQIEALSENSFGALVPSLSYLLLKRIIDLVVAAIALLFLAFPTWRALGSQAAPGFLRFGRGKAMLEPAI